MKQQNFSNDLGINGLSYLPNYISSIHEESLIKLIDAQAWNLELKRRTQAYGYKYDYKAKVVNLASYLGKMPAWLEELCHKLYLEAIFVEPPDQVIINEYLPAQGIASHIDCVGCFTNTVCSLSLGTGCMMDFTHGEMKKSIYLEAKSLLILSNEARYQWRHGIAMRKSDNGIKRQRRISITFRKAVAAQAT
jgi:alkylated DNA repair dioxygenase AlkB